MHESLAEKQQLVTSNYEGRVGGLVSVVVAVGVRKVRMRIEKEQKEEEEGYREKLRINWVRPCLTKARPI